MQKREQRSSSASGGGEEAHPLLDHASTLLAPQVPIIARLDAIAQILFSAGLIADVLPRLWERDPQECRTRQAELSFLTHGALAEVRKLLKEMGLPDLGEGKPPDAFFDKEP